MTARSFTYKNEHFNSIQEFSDKKGISNNKIYTKYIVYFDFDKPLYEVHGQRFETLTDVAKAYNLKLTALKYERKKQASIEACVDYLLSTHRRRGIFSKDFLGNEFANASAMCEYWGISPSKFCYRLNQGMSIEDAITGKKPLKKMKFLEKNRNKFTTEQYNDFLRRIKRIR